MSQYKKQVSLGGSWAKSSELQNGTRAKIVSETNPQPSSFLDKNGNPKIQDVAKIRFEGNNEPMNVSLNRATINGLVDAFGENSADWQNHYLTVETEKVRVAGKAVVALYLIPEGYKKVDDSNGYAMIVKKDTPVEDQSAPVDEYPQEDIDVDSIPF
jgi:hypothetical protein